MWIMAMFDLPTVSTTDKRRYREFREHLLKNGFRMMQWSIYLRHVPNWDHAQVHMKRVEQALPPRGAVRMISLTDKQFERMQVYSGPLPSAREQAPEQLTFL